MTARAALALAAALGAGCAAVDRRIDLPDRPPLPPGATALAYAGGTATGLFRPDGRPCQRPLPEPRRGVVGWQPAKGEDLACARDTLDHRGPPPALELAFRAVVPEDGDLDLLARGTTLDAWGRALARGGPYGEFAARTWFEYTATAPSCRAVHLKDLAKAVVTGPWDREALFSGWIVLPDLVLTGCRAGEVLEVRLRLLGEVNRGRVDVETFGVVAGRMEEVQDSLALRKRVAPPPAPAAPQGPAGGQPAAAAATPSPP